MKRTGMKRALDRLGRIVLPKEMRESMDIHIGDPLEFFIEGQELILRKYKSTMCVFCGDPGSDIYFKEQFICPACSKEIKQPSDNPQQFPLLPVKSPASSKKFSHNFYENNGFNHETKNIEKGEYSTRSKKTANKLIQLKEIIDHHPYLSQQETADRMGISQGRVSQLKKLL